MLKQLFVNLFKTLVFSSVIAVVALRVDYAIDEGFVRASLDTGFDGLPDLLILLNAVAFAVSLPALLLGNTKIYNNRWLRILFYYSSLTILIIYFTCFTLSLEQFDFSMYIFACGPVLIFLVIHTCFYFRLVKKSVPSNIALPILKDLG